MRTTGLAKGLYPGAHRLDGLAQAQRAQVAGEEQAMSELNAPPATGPRLLNFPAGDQAAAVDNDTVERLEWLLGEAREGRILGVGFVTLQPGGEIGMGWTHGCTENRLAVIGGVSCLEAMMHQTLAEVT